MAQPESVSAEQPEQTQGAGAAGSKPASFAPRVVARIRELLANRRMPLAVAVLAAIVMLPALRGGWQMDDYFQRCTLLGYGDTKPIQVFEPYPDRANNLAQLAFGTMPWWGSTDMHQVFFRYASALSMMLDYRLWPDHPALMHLHSLLWLAATIFAAALLYREMMGATWIAGLAALMYALDGAHAVPAEYLANRNALISCCFGFFSLLTFVRWRKQARPRDRWLSVLMLALSLSAYEMGVATAAYLFSYALIVDRDGIRARVVRLIPHGAVLGAWALTYKIGNFGTRGSGFYIDPLHNPIGFAGLFCRRAAYLLMGQWTPVPAEMAMAYPAGSAAALHLTIFAFVSISLLVLVFIPLVLGDRIARFWGFGAMLSLVPIAAVGPENRVLGFVGLGSMALLAQLTEFVFARAYVASTPRVWKGFAWTMTLILLLDHVLAAPLLGLARIAYQGKVNSRLDAAMASVPNDPQLASQELVLINPPDHVYLVGEIWAVKRLENSPMPRHIRELSTGGTLDVTRVGPRSLEVSFPNGFFSNDFGRYLRSPDEHFSTGQRFELPGLSVTVESLDRQGDPAEVLYEFPVTLEDPSLRWIRWHAGVYVPWTPPSIGKTETFAPERGIW